MVNQPDRGNGAFQTITAFAAGAAIGSVVALLYAPASGTVTRRRIGLKVKEIQRTAGRRLGQTTKLLARKAALLREAAAERFDGARHWVVEQVSNGHAKRPLRHREARHA